jgi:hypothetical protein
MKHEQIPSTEISHRLARCTQLLLAWSFSEFHAHAHEKAGLGGIVSEAAPYVIHVEIAVACLQENIARDIDANCAAGEPRDLRACSKSADIALESQEEPASEVNLTAEANDGIYPPLVTGFRCREGLFDLFRERLGELFLSVGHAVLDVGGQLILRGCDVGCGNSRGEIAELRVDMLEDLRKLPVLRKSLTLCGALAQSSRTRVVTP